MNNSKLTKKQTRIFSRTADSMDITVTVRHDDECGNGHNTFAITADIYKAGKPKTDSNMIMCGCCHDEVAEYFPELAPLIKWHLCSTDGPMHYLANTLYLAGTKDHNRLQAGEVRQIINGRTRQPVWKAVALDAQGTFHDVSGFSWIDAAEQPKNDGNIEWQPVTRTGEGKEAQLEAARNAAIWPDATLEQLTDRKQLEARLPGLMTDFRAAVESLGMEY